MLVFYCACEKELVIKNTLGWGVAEVTECMLKSPGFSSQYCIKLRMMTHTYNPSIGEVGRGGSGLGVSLAWAI